MSYSKTKCEQIKQIVENVGIEEAAKELSVCNSGNAKRWHFDNCKHKI